MSNNLVERYDNYPSVKERTSGVYCNDDTLKIIFISLTFHYMLEIILYFNDYNNCLLLVSVVKNKKVKDCRSRSRYTVTLVNS